MKKGEARSMGQILKKVSNKTDGHNDDQLKTILELIKKPSLIYSILVVVSLIGLLLVFLVTRGEAMAHFFFYDTVDTGMDFFHSIEYVRSRQPYEIFNTVYPPLANFFFLVVYAFIPKSIVDNWTYDFSESVSMRRTSLDLRTYQSCLIIFILFIIVIIYLLSLVVNKYGNQKGVENLSFITAGFIFSYGSLYAYERGNIVILAAVFSMFFACFYSSENKIVRELALISLAIASGLKLYPALLGILLLKGKDIAVILRTILYGVLSVILPCFAFKEGLRAIPLWLDVLFDFGSSSSEPWFGNGIPNAVAEGAHLIDVLFGSNLCEISFKGVGIVLAIVLMGFALLFNKTWESVLTLCFAMLFQSQGAYFYCMILIPLLLFLGEEKKFTKENIVPFIVMMCMVLPLPILYERDVLYPRDMMVHFAMVIYFVWCIIVLIRRVKLRQVKF